MLEKITSRCYSFKTNKVIRNFLLNIVTTDVAKRRVVRISLCVINYTGGQRTDMNIQRNNSKNPFLHCGRYGRALHELLFSAENNQRIMQCALSTIVKLVQIAYISQDREKPDFLFRSITSK